MVTTHPLVANVTEKLGSPRVRHYCNREGAKTFHKTAPCMSKLTYHQRLVKVGLESLELRGIGADLVFAYNIIFGFTVINTEDIFTVCASNSRRGHGYKLYMPYSKSTAGYNYLAIE